MQDEKSPGDWIDSEGEPGLVSIVIPTYNRSALLAETLASIYEQEYRPIQIVVVDDESVDNTADMLAELRERSVPEVELRYLRQSKAGGPAARNLGLRNTTGEFIVFMDDDDVFNRKFLSAHIAELNADQDVDLSYCRWQRFMRNDTHYQILQNKKGVFPPSAKSAWEALLVGWTWLLQSSVIRREFVRKTGPWRLDLLKSQDLDYKAKLAAGDCRVIEAREAAVFYRVHGGSISGGLDAAKLESYVHVLDDIEQMAMARDDYESLRPQVADFFWDHSYWLYTTGSVQEGLRTFQQARRHDDSVGYRRGHRISRFMNAIGLGNSVGSVLYALFQIKKLMLGPPKPRVVETLTSLPDRVDDD